MVISLDVEWGQGIDNTKLLMKIEVLILLYLKLLSEKAEPGRAEKLLINWTQIDILYFK